ncbi:hypothetical protein ASPTUDRAFT_127856 [Aspergillus tubingensis CBS 134.48]|uniref:DUF7580 domain-containing protein n=1 Tax=Aspergillus tubingensis (strain CBS 134.48) TaxID=767770 RepID=A0A1L9MWY8_ASPTC|nr:hypothetical protein ASPTUDRAFT_127856 [Aspergillus tubingensis CBS 134.48]
MATGIEAASFVLAILPLLVNQLEDYVQGFDKLAQLGSKRHQRDMQTKHNTLKAEMAILLNTIHIAVDGITQYEFGDWTSISNSQFWTDDNIQQKLERKLGSSYDLFISLANELKDQLERLSAKLGVGVGRTGRVCKIRNFFLSGRYKDLFDQIGSSNRRLQTLVGQCKQIREISARSAVSQESLARHQKGRQLASSLHNAIMNGVYWQCVCKTQHRLYFTFDSLNTPWTRDPSSKPNSDAIKFEMEILTLENPNRWHEVEAKPDSHSLPQELCRDSHATSSQQGLSTDGNILNISFPQGVSGTEQGTVIGAQDLPAAVQITNMCVSLSAVGINESNEMLLGYVTDTKHRHNIYHLRSNTDSVRNIQSRTLEELIAILSSSPSDITCRNSLTVQKRLRIAVNLACAVLQFDGSWLKKQWRARDIKVINDPRDSTPVTYVEWDLNNEPRRLHESQVPAGEPFIHLGFVLVELSLGQTLEVLQTQEDHDQVQVVANRNTALRLLPDVKAQSGSRYFQVVEQCLNWPNCTLDDIDFTKAFQSIIAPLVNEWRVFEGEEPLY